MSVTFWIPGVNDEGVNMANANASALLRVLDLDFEELCGQSDASDLIARIEMTLAIEAHLEAVRPTVEANVPSGARWINFGIDADYVETRLAQLLALAEQARDHGQQVVWS